MSLENVLFSEEYTGDVVMREALATPGEINVMVDEFSGKLRDYLVAAVDYTDCHADWKPYKSHSEYYEDAVFNTQYDSPIDSVIKDMLLRIVQTKYKENLRKVFIEVNLEEYERSAQVRGALIEVKRPDDPALTCTAKIIEIVGSNGYCEIVEPVKPKSK